MKKDHLDFFISKNSFKDGEILIKTKFVLYNYCDNAYIEKILSDNGIDIKEEEIVRRYRETYDLSIIIDEFCGKYDSQLDKLEEKFILLDADCIVYYINKVIRDNFNPYKCPDPYFLAQCLEDFRSKAIFFDAKEFSNYLDVINKIKDYHGNDWDVICDKADEDVSECLTDCVVTFLPDVEMNKTTARKLIKQLKEFLDNNNIENDFIIYNGIIMIAYNLTEKELRAELEEGCQRYPQYALYFTANLGMTLYDLDIYPKYAQELIEKSQKMQPQSDDDEDFQQQASEYINKNGSSNRLLS